MSIKIITRVFEDHSFNSTRKLIMIALADNANDEGVCYPSIDTICKKTSLGRTTVKDNIKIIIKSGALQKSFRSRKSGGRYNNIYLLYPDENYAKLDVSFSEYFKEKSAIQSTGADPLQSTGADPLQSTGADPLQSTGADPVHTTIEPSLNNRHREGVNLKEKKADIFNTLNAHQKIQYLQSKLNKSIGMIKTRIFTNDLLSAKELAEQIEDPDDFIAAYVEHKKTLQDKKYLKSMFSFMAGYVDGSFKSQKKLEDDYAIAIHDEWQKLDDGNFAMLNGHVIDPFTGKIIPGYWDKQARL